MHSRRSSIAYLVVSMIMLITGLYNTLVLNESLHVFYSFVIAALYVYLVGLPRLLIGFSWCLLASGLTSFSTLSSIVLPFFLVYIHEGVPHRSSDTYLSLKLFVAALIFMPLYILRIQTLVPAASYLVSVLAMTFLSYVRLSKSQVVLSKTSFSAYLGDYVEVPLKIVSEHRVSYKVLLDESLFTEGLVKGSKELVVKLLPNIAGVKMYSIKVVLSDLKGFSRITYGPFMVRVKVMPKSLTIVRSIREVLSRYVESIKPPIIHVGWLEVSVSPRIPALKGAVGSEASSGYTGVGAAGSSTGLIGGTLGEGGVSGGQGLDSGLSSLYDGVIRYRFRWVTPAKILELIGLQSSKTSLGDYLGVREYYPGDHPRSIHWKKSVSTGELAVKIYTRSGEGGGGKSSLVIADWDASNPVELDNLIQATYSALLMEKHIKILYLKLPSGKVYFIKGSILEVLKALDLVISTEDVESRFNYESWVRVGMQNLIEEFRVANEPLRSIDKYYRILCDSLVDELEKQGLPKNSSFIIVHPKAYAVKYLYLTHKLRMSGYTVTHLTKVLQPSEVSTMLREVIKSME